MEVGRIIGGKYRLQNVIGEGAMGSVWAGIHEVLGRPVAIKFLLPSAEGEDTAAARFVAEAQAAARVKHRFTVDVFDFGITEDGGYYMVQELLEGEPLSECMYEGPPWLLADVLHFTAQCLSGLEAVHQSGIVHRDLKPDNIFVIRDGEGSYPKLLDFGISRAAEVKSGRPLHRFAGLRAVRPRRLTGTGTTLGTPAYMSPEQLCNANTMNGRADLYSMGVVLFEWLSGTVPFGDSANTVELYRRISSRSGPSIRALRPDLGPDVWGLIDRALEPDPDQRFSSAGEMRAHVLRIMSAVPRVWTVVQKDAGPEGAMAARPSERDFDTEPSMPAGVLRMGGISLSRPWLWGLGGSAVGGLLLTAVLMQGGLRSFAHPRGAAITTHLTDSKVEGRAGLPQAAAPKERSPQARAVEPASLPEGREPPEQLEIPDEIARVTAAPEVDPLPRARLSRRRSRRDVRKQPLAQSTSAKTSRMTTRGDEENARAATPTNAKVVRTPDF